MSLVIGWLYVHCCLVQRSDVLTCNIAASLWWMRKGHHGQPVFLGLAARYVGGCHAMRLSPGGPTGNLELPVVGSGHGLVSNVYTHDDRNGHYQNGQDEDG